ncbi:MAG TPA: FAD-linked oxidase C-terminal domain-containing protein [Acidimicrobiales bacterium]|nr:FAD-linked oxidase C-terminal domain-containing protein [Acidimicrobiales bacterium]
MSHVEELRATLDASSVVTDPDVFEAFRHDQSTWAEPGMPSVLVRPRTTDEVVRIVRAANRYRVPIVPRGAGSGLSGGATAIEGCIVLSLDRMDAVLDVAPDDLVAVVQPGVLNGTLKATVAEEGLWYPPDPASAAFSSLGGNIATNAGGLCCLKYGTTRHWVLGLEAVLGDGRVVRTGGRTVKSVAGYDLTGLLVGSEGTLGVVTEATLRLAPAPPPRATLVAVFPTLAQAGAAVVAVVRRVVPSMLEIMDRTTVRAVDDWKRMELDRDAAALVLAQSDAPTPDARRRELDAVAELCRDHGALYEVATDDPDEGEQLLMARRLAYPALERLGATVLDDVSVPRSAVASLVSACEQVADEHGVIVATFGHAGDGNLHPTIVYDRNDAGSCQRARTAFEAVVNAAVSLGGTVTGEHGVGSLKHSLLPLEIDPVRTAVHQDLKRALDPNGILNPGRAV